MIAQFYPCSLRGAGDDTGTAAPCTEYQDSALTWVRYD